MFDYVKISVIYIRVSVNNNWWYAFTLYSILLVYEVIYDYKSGKFHEIEDDDSWYVLGLNLLIVGLWACDGYRGDAA